MADTKLSALSEISVPALEDLLYVVDDPSGTPTSVKVTATRLGGLMARAICHGRLTTESGVAVSTSDRSAQGTIYFTPYGGHLVALFDGTRWRLYTLTEVSLALSALTSGKNYDVFLYDNAGTLTLELSAAWTNDTTRADALTTQDAVLVKSGATTRRYVGTIRTTGTTTTEDSSSKRFVWNYYNQVPRYMQRVDGTDTWSYTTDSWRQANGAAANQVEYVSGDAALHVEAFVGAVVFLQNSARAAKVAVGVDSTSTPSGLRQGGYASVNTIYAPVSGTYAGQPGLGYHFLAWIEKGADGTSTFLGDNGADGQQTGIQAVIRG